MRKLFQKRGKTRHAGIQYGARRLRGDLPIEKAGETDWKDCYVETNVKGKWKNMEYVCGGMNLLMQVRYNDGTGECSYAVTTSRSSLETGWLPQPLSPAELKAMLLKFTQDLLDVRNSHAAGIDMQFAEAEAAREMKRNPQAYAGVWQDDKYTYEIIFAPVPSFQPPHDTIPMWLVKRNGRGINGCHDFNEAVEYIISTTSYGDGREDGVLRFLGLKRRTAAEYSATTQAIHAEKMEAIRDRNARRAAESLQKAADERERLRAEAEQRAIYNSRVEAQQGQGKHKLQAARNDALLNKEQGFRVMDRTYFKSWAGMAEVFAGLDPQLEMVAETKIKEMSRKAEFRASSSEQDQHWRKMTEKGVKTIYSLRYGGGWRMELPKAAFQMYAAMGFPAADLRTAFAREREAMGDVSFHNQRQIEALRDLFARHNLNFNSDSWIHQLNV